MKQKLKFITCSGANEHTNIEELVSLSNQYPIVEWGIQVSGKKCSVGTPRLEWIHNLHDFLQSTNTSIKLALHINADWVDAFTSGEIPQELTELLRLKNVDGRSLFYRIQLNFKIGRDKAPQETVLISRMKQYGTDHRFILSYNDDNKTFIHYLYRQGVRNFDTLYDASHGEGIGPSQWLEPAFYDESILQGYAGGLSPENVVDELLKIKGVVPFDRAFYIDAEGKLKGDNKHLSLKKCEQYITNALNEMQCNK